VPVRRDRACRIGVGWYTYRGCSIDRLNPEAPSYPWIITWPDDSTSDCLTLTDACARIDALLPATERTRP
jgi:hypothetical protein